MAFAETYVDPSIAANSGSGTIGDPYGDLQYALDTMPQSSAGDRVNIKAGADEILSSPISLASYGTPAYSAPLIFSGYTAVAGDGGVGGISGGGACAVFSGATGYVSFADLHLHSTGSADVLTVGPYGNGVVRCEIDNTTGSGISLHGTVVLGCHIHNVGGYGVYHNGTACIGGLLVADNYFANGVNRFSHAIALNDNGIADSNIISINGESGGIRWLRYACAARGNTIWSDDGSGNGVDLTGGIGVSGSVLNNLIAGFTTGNGILAVTSNDPIAIGHNAIYNCAAAYNVTADTRIDLGDNETLTSDPFARFGSDTFANRYGYFAPSNIGNVWRGAYPPGANRDKGAVQHAAGGLLRHSGMSGGFGG